MMKIAWQYLVVERYFFGYAGTFSTLETDCPASKWQRAATVPNNPPENEKPNYRIFRSVNPVPASHSSRQEGRGGLSPYFRSPA